MSLSTYLLNSSPYSGKKRKSVTNVMSLSTYQLNSSPYSGQKREQLKKCYKCDVTVDLPPKFITIQWGKKKQLKQCYNVMSLSTYLLNSSQYSAHQKRASETVLHECDATLDLPSKFITIECTPKESRWNSVTDVTPFSTYLLNSSPYNVHQKRACYKCDGTLNLPPKFIIIQSTPKRAGETVLQHDVTLNLPPKFITIQCTPKESKRKGVKWMWHHSWLTF